MIRVFATCLLLLAGGGCSTLPGAGPTAADFEDGASASLPEGVRLELVDLDASTAGVVAYSAPPRFSGTFRGRSSRSSAAIGVGDAVSVVIYEAGQGGVFSSQGTERNEAGTRGARLPEQQVARDGTIGVPYAGRVRAAGLTAQAVEARIVDQLAGKAVEPQAIVAVTKNVANSVTVTGDVVAGGRFPLTLGGDRVLDVIGLAGGLRAPAHETFVVLTRGSRTSTAPYAALVMDPSENVYVQGGDTVSLIRRQRTISALGATGVNIDIPFSAPTMTLVQAMSKAGGLLDQRADPSAVFVMRREPVGLLRRLRGAYSSAAGPVVPVVYRLNMRDPRSFSVAQSFEMRDTDVMYVSNAPYTELTKAFALFNTLASPALTAGAVAITAAK